MERLPVGDYDVGGKTLVERKSVLDLHSCLVTGRLWSQIGSLRKEARYPFLLVEGADIDDGPLPRAALRGACLSAMRLGIRIIQTKDQRDSALWMYRLAICASAAQVPAPVSRSQHRCERQDLAT
jgi:ERCC4-type nuclease